MVKTWWVRLPTWRKGLMLIGLAITLAGFVLLALSPFVDEASAQSSVPAQVLLTPADGQANPGTDYTLTATVLDSADQPVSGVDVTFRVAGANNLTAGLVTTNANGQAAFSYSSAVEAYDRAEAIAGGIHSGDVIIRWVVTEPPQERVTRFYYSTEITINEVVWGCGDTPCGYRQYNAPYVTTLLQGTESWNGLWHVDGLYLLSVNTTVERHQALGNQMPQLGRTLGELRSTLRSQLAAGYIRSEVQREYNRLRKLGCTLPDDPVEIVGNGNIHCP